MGDTIPFPPCFGISDLVGCGISGLVLRLDAALKVPSKEQEQEAIEIERQVYQRLNNGHDGILRCLGSFQNGILLQYACHGSLRQYFARGGDRSKELQIRWIHQVVEAVLFVHSHNILHADLSCNNVFLDENLNAKLGDFAGSSIDGAESLVCYETRYDHPNTTKVSIESEIFALGSMIYEIQTGVRPFHDLSEAEVEKAYSREEFPDVSCLSMLQSVVEKCWKQSYTDAQALLTDIKTQVSESDSTPLGKADNQELM